MQEIGYQRGLIVHGKDNNNEKGMDELSTIGVSTIHEFFPDGKTELYKIAPEDVGIKRTKFDKIAAINDINDESIRFLEIISGKKHNECIDITSLNSGAILYLADKAKDIKEGINISKDIIESGKALKKLTHWICTQSDSQKNGIKKYIHFADKANIKNEVLKEISI